MVSPVQEHQFYVDIAATPDELWELFWLRRALTQNGDVTIEILHPGDEIGEGLVRHCTFRVPRYLLSGGPGPVMGVADRGHAQGLLEVQRRRQAAVVEGRGPHPPGGPGRRA